MLYLLGEGRPSSTLVGLVSLLSSEVLVGNMQSHQFIDEHPKREDVNLCRVGLEGGREGGEGGGRGAGRMDKSY